MHDLFIIFVILLVLLTFISTFGGSIYAKENYGHSGMHKYPAESFEYEEEGAEYDAEAEVEEYEEEDDGEYDAEVEEYQEADDMPEEAADGMIPLPDSAPAAEGDPVKPASKEPRDPAELVQKGVDPQLETAVLLLQANALGRGVPSAAAPATPAQRMPAAAKPADKARS